MEEKLIKNLRKRLEIIYKDADKAEHTIKEIAGHMEKYSVQPESKKDFSEKDSILITYGDTITDGNIPGLKVLNRFLKEFIGSAVDSVHLLPMYPYTSDDGFSVTDYRKINPDLGDWKDIEDLSKSYGLMFDAVINHISRSSKWFQGYLEGEKPYTDYFITCDPNEDYSQVTRPRSLPLLTCVDAKDGNKYVWTTFSDDQIDLNFGCPELLAEILDILVMYGRKGAKYIRLDAVGFMWKEKGTCCMNLPQTHELIKLMKDVLRVYAPGTRIITETNVPHKDNISYFGTDGDEADLVYQFALPPLTMYTLVTGNAAIIMNWIETLELPSEKVTYFNFLSSHDGIGIRPTEGILTAAQQETLINATLKNGGAVSYKDNGDGTKSPYELNINYQDALAGPDESDKSRIRKFLAAETLLLSLQGVPGIYIHSLLGSRNDYYGKAVSGIPRRINREKLDYSCLCEQLQTDTNRKYIFDEMMRRLHIRQKEKAFSPKADQRVIRYREEIVSFIRKNNESAEEILVLINVSGRSQKIADAEINGRDILNDRTIEGSISLFPWECAWIKRTGM